MFYERIHNKFLNKVNTNRLPGVEENDLKEMLV